MLFHDFSDIHDVLLDFSVAQFTYLNFLEYDSTTKLLRETSDANTRRVAAMAIDKYAFWNWWLRFGVGFESLVKAVFLKNEINILTKKEISKKGIGGTKELSTPASARVYAHVKTSNITSNSNAWLQAELQTLGIQHPLEMNTGTLGHYKNNMGLLEAKGLISATEKIQILDAIEVLSDIRRNVDAHVFLKSQTGGSINGDLVDVYIPVCNIFFRAFS